MPLQVLDARPQPLELAVCAMRVARAALGKEPLMNIDDELNDPGFFATDQHYPLFDRMRAEDPVHWTHSPNRRGYGSIFHHANVKTILNEPILFSFEREGVAPVVDTEMAAIVREASGVEQNVAMIDPPRHAEFRDVIAAPFLPKALTEGEARTKILIGEIFDQLPSHGEIDRVNDLAVRIPMAVICDVLLRPARRNSCAARTP